MQTRLRVILTVLGLLPLLGLAQKAPDVLPDDPDAAWAVVDKVHEALRAPSQWRKQPPTADEMAAFEAKIRQQAYVYAEKARQFTVCFPTNENCRDARVTIVFALSHAVAVGDTNAERRINSYVHGVLSDKSIPEDDRVAVLMYSANTEFMKKVGTRIYTGITPKMQAEYEASSLIATREALRMFPSNSMLYTMLVSVAQKASPEVQHKLSLEIINAPGAPEVVKELASHIFEGSKPYVIGTPIPMKFTAFDGREFDLAQYKGKVVVLYYWSAAAKSCETENLVVKALYDKYHTNGLEVVGINMDEKVGPLKAYLKSNPVPWPQYYDGKGWQNKFGLKYGVFDVPTLWVIDRRGELRNVDARVNLEPLVASLLDPKNSR